MVRRLQDVRPAVGRAQKPALLPGREIGREENPPSGQLGRSADRPVVLPLRLRVPVEFQKPRLPKGKRVPVPEIEDGNPQLPRPAIFVTGTSSVNMAKPIIGPPEISFSGSVLNPPAASTNSAWFIPNGTLKLPG